MKKTILLLAVLMGFAFVSCSDDDSSNDGKNNKVEVEVTEANLVGTWKLSGTTVDGVPEAIEECPFIIVVTQQTITEKEFYGTNCEEIETFTVDYELEGSFVKMDGNTETVEIISLTATTLKVKTVTTDEGTFVDTFARQ